MRIYLAGPMRGYEQFNFPAFDEAATRLRDLGYEVFSPAERDRDEGFDAARTLEDQGFSVEEAMRADLAYITTEAEAIALLPGWEQSSGARAERFVAETTGRLVYLYDLASRGVLREAPSWSRKLVDDDSETRVVNPATGGEKGTKLARYDLLPADALRQVAEHYGKGAAKYAARNWERGYDWSLSFAALQRHCWQWMAGEDIDEETGSHHMAAVAFHAFALLTFAGTHPELDDRP